MTKGKFDGFDPSDDQLDPGCRNLCMAINRLPGVYTVNSCCGHGREPFRVWIYVNDFNDRSLLLLARLTCNRYYEFPFDLVLDHGDVPEGQVSFLLQAREIRPNDTLIYGKADRLAACINDHLDRKINYYNIYYDEPNLNTIFGLCTLSYSQRS